MPGVCDTTYQYAVGLHTQKCSSMLAGLCGELRVHARVGGIVCSALAVRGCAGAGEPLKSAWTFMGDHLICMCRVFRLSEHVPSTFWWVSPPRITSSIRCRYNGTDAAWSRGSHSWCHRPSTTFSTGSVHGSRARSRHIFWRSDPGELALATCWRPTAFSTLHTTKHAPAQTTMAPGPSGTHTTCPVSEQIYYTKATLTCCTGGQYSLQKKVRIEVACPNRTHGVTISSCA